MKPSAKHSMGQDIDEALRIIEKNGGLGEKPPSQVELFVKLYITLKHLNPRVARESTAMLLEAVGIRGERGRKEKGDQALRYQSTMSILRRLHGKRKTSVSAIMSTRLTTQDLYDYIWLRSRGFLQKTRDGRLRVSPSIYSMDPSPQMREVGFREIIKYAGEIPSRLWGMIFRPSLARSFPTGMLTRLASKYYGFNSTVDRVLADELTRRINRGESVEWDKITARRKLISNILTRHRVKTPEILPFMDTKMLRKIPHGELQEMINELSLGERRIVASRLIKNDLYTDIISQLDPITLSTLNTTTSDRELHNKILLGKSLVEAIRYYITGDKARLDYSRYLLGKIRPEQLQPDLKPIYVSLLEGNIKKAVTLASRKDPYTAIEAISMIIREKQRLENKVLMSQIRRALELGYMILNRIARKPGQTGKKQYNTLTGRLSVRRTLRNMVSNRYVPVKIRRRERPRNILLIDTSGSMLRYSLQSIITAAKFLPLMGYIVVFSDKSIIIRIKTASTRVLLTSFLAKLYMQGFKGYTDIAGALRQALQLGRRRDKIILISDLEQTVPGGSIVDYAGQIIRSGRRLIVITPPHHNVSLAEELRKMGVEIHGFAEALKTMGRIMLS